ncbi:MAG: family transporter protein [Thermoleophilia bacterium]|nr:family transporter protein [Thermoleophilia bacterium]
MSADIVIYRRMRGVFWGLLVIGLIGAPLLLALAFSVPSRLELYSADAIEQVGSAETVFSGAYGVIFAIASLAALVLGATAGSVDLQRGVVRDLVLAGRPRWRIVLGRLAGAFALLVAAVTLSLALVLLVAVTLSPDRTIDDWERIWRSIAEIGVTVAFTLPLAAGFALLIGSRGPAIVVFFLTWLLVDNVLFAIPKLGEWWEQVSLSIAAGQVLSWVRNGEADQMIDRGVGAAALVVVGWMVIPLVAGIVRLSRRDL